MADLEALKLKRDQLNARIQQAEARQRATAKKADDRVKVLVGAAVLHQPPPSFPKPSSVFFRNWFFRQRSATSCFSRPFS